MNFASRLQNWYSVTWEGNESLVFDYSVCWHDPDGGGLL